MRRGYDVKTNQAQVDDDNFSDFDLVVSKRKEIHPVRVKDWNRTVGVNIVINIDKASQRAGFSNPILVAEKVMTETDHLILGGEGAQLFARRMGFEEYDCVTEKARARLEEVKREGSPFFPKLNRALGMIEEKMGTVGAVAIDRNGHLAAATSSGGIAGRMTGRVGDSCLPGCGTYASAYGAVSCTGHGEGIIKLFLAKDIVERMKTLPAPTALTLALSEAKRKKVLCGAVGFDARGGICYGHTTPDMAWGYKVADRLFLFTDNKRK
ncbi:MAG: isoaspartyl peptidase/L-asparaginase [candidate division WOR-3 bacterium]